MKLYLSQKNIECILKINLPYHHAEEVRKFILQTNIAKDYQDDIKSFFSLLSPSLIMKIQKHICNKILCKNKVIYSILKIESEVLFNQ